jgi:hypothetical protein
MSEPIRVLFIAVIGYLVGWMDRSWLGLALFVAGILTGQLIASYLGAKS